MLSTVNYNIQEVISVIINNIFIQSFITYYMPESSFDDCKAPVSIVIDSQNNSWFNAEI